MLHVVFATLLAAAMAPATADTSGYTLIWHDEFNTDGTPDPAKWGYESGFVRNHEPQWYQPQNAVCRNGLLVIEARKEKVKNTNYDPTSKAWQRNREFAEYTSACLITKGKFDFKYGRVEMRAKIDVRKGMWPAFWMLGKGGWPACGEVDIMEFYRGDLLANWCWEGDRKVSWNTGKFPVAPWGGEKWAQDFHNWTLEWDENKMEILLDGKVINSQDLSQTINHNKGNNPFRENFFLLVNLALGKDGEEIPDAHMPAQLLVDYIRVYQQ
jgi:beta-glucanase (GH16 family)